MAANIERNNRKRSECMELVAGSHTTGFEYISYVSAVDGNRVVVCGNVGEEWRITQFSLIHGGKLRSIVLNEKPNGLASITLGEKAWLFHTCR